MRSSRPQPATAIAYDAAPTRRRTALAWLLAAVLIGVTLITGSGPAAATGPDTGSFVAAVNASRTQAGLRPYAVRADLSSVAYRWAAQMAASGRLAHNPSLAGQVSNWSYLGENVGYGPDWRTIETALMNSPKHRANILDHDFTEIGIGVVVNDGRMWVAQVFRKPDRASTTTTARTSTTATKPATKPVAKPATRPAVAPAARAAQPAPKPAAEPARPTGPDGPDAQTADAAPPAADPSTPSPDELLLSRISDAQRAVQGDDGDPLAQAVAFVQAMDIVTG